jgi:hypothetical protein
VKAKIHVAETYRLLLKVAYGGLYRDDLNIASVVISGNAENGSTKELRKVIFVNAPSQSLIDFVKPYF